MDAAWLQRAGSVSVAVFFVCVQYICTDKGQLFLLFGVSLNRLTPAMQIFTQKRSTLKVTFKVSFSFQRIFSLHNSPADVSTNMLRT